MRIKKNLSTDQETIKRFLDALGGGAVMLGSSKLAGPGFFIYAHGFIHDYIEGGFFRKEELLIKVLEQEGFPSDDGPVAAMRNDQAKSREAAEYIINAAKQWQAGDTEARPEVGWAASQYTSAMRQHLERLKNLIFPLLEQTITLEEEQKVAEELNKIIFENALNNRPDNYMKIIETLEDELNDWR